MVPAGSPSTETPRAGAGRFPARRARTEHRHARELSRDLDAQFVRSAHSSPKGEPVGFVAYLPLPDGATLHQPVLELATALSSAVLATAACVMVVICLRRT